jgi:hypothetical protein
LDNIFIFAVIVPELEFFEIEGEVVFEYAVKFDQSLFSIAPKPL